MQIFHSLTIGFTVVSGIALGVFLGIRITYWFERTAAPIVARLLELAFPYNPDKGISIPPGFNAVVGVDEHGWDRSADTFEEWLEKCVPTNERHLHNSFFDRIGFHRYKRREGEYAHMVGNARRNRLNQAFTDSSSSEH